MPAMNPAVEQAIVRQLQKPAPFTDEDLARVVMLAVLRPTGLDGMERLSRLRALVITGYGGRDLDALAGLAISTMDIRVSAVDNLEIVTQLPRLRTLIVKNCAVEEIDVLAESEHRVDELDLTGNPLSEHAYTEVLPHLGERIDRSLLFSSEREWRLTRRLHASGLPFGYYRDTDGYHLCRPGLRYTDTPDGDHLTIEPDELERILDRDPSQIPGLFASYDE